MDELDLIKKDWQKRNQDLPKYTQDELVPMLHKKSSSSVRWIFIISVLEFAFWIAVELLSSSDEYLTMIKSKSLFWFIRISTVANYIILVGFIYLFFKNYLRIQVTDSARQLMRQIIKTRQTVKYYVRYNIIFFAVCFILASAEVISHQATLNTNEFWIISGVMAFLLFIIIGFLLLFYRVLYGILTKRLYRNYKQLNQMEM
jgi:hypothetical protein